MKYKETGTGLKAKPSEEIRQDIKSTESVKKSITIPKKRLIGSVSGLILLIVIVVAVLFFTNIIGSGKQNKVLEKSIAVLPFKLLSDEPDKQYLADGMMDAILLHLSKIKDLRVMSRTSVEQYRGTKKTISEIGKELGVEYLLEGSFQKFGDNVKLIVQLIRASKESHAWANEYDSKWSEVFSLQSEVAQTVAKELHAIINPEEKQQIERVPTTSLTAYDFYQRGREELTNYEIDNYNKAALEKAEDLFHKALKYDSTFAQSYAGLAKVYWKKHSSVREYFSENFLDSVRILCDRALTFDNKLAEVYTVRGDYYAEKESLNKAIDEYNKALRTNPNTWEAYYGKGETYADDDLLESIKNFQKAASLNHGKQLPIILRCIALEYCSAGFIDKVYYYDLEALKLDGDSSIYLSNLAIGEKYQNNVEKAIEFLQKAYSMDTTQYNTAVQLGHCYMFLNQFKETFRSYKKYVEILRTLGTFSKGDMHRFGWAYSENGYRKEAKYFFEKQLEYSKNLIHFKRSWGQKLYPYYDMAGVYAYLGEKEKAFECLRVFNQRKRMPLWVVTFLKIDPLFNSIRNEPEFQQIARDVEAKYQAEHERVRKWLEEQGML
jgi:TolB-like protein/Tfp pilus assembly protein PilF